MKGLILLSTNQTEHNFLHNLLKRLGINYSEISIEEIEDLGLAKMLKSVDKANKVSRKSVMHKLKS